MNLYAHKDENIRKTWFLLAMFVAVVGAFGYALGLYFDSPDILIIAVVLAMATSWGSYWYSDKLVLGMAHARPVSREEAAELHMIVENLAITAGLPKPKIYIVDDPSPNAFATGRDPAHAVVAVTTGLLMRLDRAELEGVIAHELSHVGNRDMLVSTVAASLVGVISIAGDMMLRSMAWGGRGRDDREGGRSPVFAVLAILGAVLMPIAATLIQLAISRKREFLADASGALLTRHPDALARALMKISAAPQGVRSANTTTAHLWIESPFKGKASSFVAKLFMTHPPVEERVKALRGK